MRERVATWMRATVWGFPARDLGLAAAFLAIALASVLTGNPDEGSWAVTIPVAVASALARAWRERSGIVAVVVVSVAGLVQTVLATSPGSLWSLALHAIVMYSVAAHYREGMAALAGVLLLAAVLVEERIDNGVDYLFIVLLFGGIWLLGRASRHWRARVGRAEQRQRDAARLAVAEERVRLARELHDVIAHSLGVIAVQSDAAAAALERDPRRAREPVAAISATARDALAEIRSLLDVLRAGDADRPGTESPGISAISGLVASARAAGLPVTARIEMTSDPVPPALDLAAYRMVQEGLTNVLRHAGRTVTEVSIAQSVDALAIAVVNGPGDASGSGSGSGYGLVGIRERMAAIGGAVEAGRTPDGGWRLAADVPLHRAPSRAPTAGVMP